MLINRTHDYAIRIMRCAASHDMPTARRISELENIPYEYTRTIAARLTRSGLLIGTKAAALSGYSLARAADRISLYDIIRAVDREFCINYCFKSGAECPMNEPDGACGVHKTLASLQDTIIAALSDAKLSEYNK